jgi:hypothetical protein
MNRAGGGDADDDALRLGKSESVDGDVSVDERPGQDEPARRCCLPPTLERSSA